MTFAAPPGCRDPGVRAGDLRRTAPAARRTAPAVATPASAPVTSSGTALAAPEPVTPVPAAPTVSVDLPPMPVSKTRAYTVSQPAITDAATAYVAAGGDPADSPCFFFGDLATSSLDILASRSLTRDQVRVEMGNPAVSGYFGGIWLRDNLRAAEPPQPGQPVPAGSQTGGVVSAVGLRMFSQLVAGLEHDEQVPLISTPRRPRISSGPARLYGYNKGYLEYMLDNPPAGCPR